MKVSPNAWKNWPVLGALLGVIALGALGLAYWSSIQDRERYLQGRNFRLLADLASQTSNLVETRARIFRDTVTDRTVRLSGSWRARAADQMRLANPESELAHAEILEPAPPASPPTPAAVAAYRLAVRGEGASIRITWVPPRAGVPALTMRVPAAAALAELFRPRLATGAFDTLALATPNGHVVYAVGRRATELGTMSLAAFLPVSPTTGRADLGRLAEAIAEERVRIAGVAYRLFSQPCCASDAYAASPGPPAPVGFVIVGLVEADVMRAASWAISPVLVLFGIAFVMGAVVSWPFLKCALTGPQQRISRLDVIGLGVAGQCGLALATILLLSIAAYSRLSADVDEQLAGLADRLDAHFSSEVRGAARQSAAMLATLRPLPCVTPTSVRDAVEGRTRSLDPCEATTGSWSDLRAPLAVSEGNADYIAFALLDTTGYQRVKTALEPTARRQLSVADRDYFKEARIPDRLWRADVCRDGCYLESSWSWTSGKPQVVLSRPTGLDALPVAALSLRMRSVIDPVLPPGFEFAIVDRDGTVHFHSDKQRNVHENLLLETDGNRRLQSLITAHGAGGFNTSYWGRPYRAYVRPTIVPDWSIVTLHDKQQTRPLVLEWTAGALAIQGVYLLVWVAGMAFVWWRGPAWLWPDPKRRPWYGVIALVCVAVTAVWAGLAARLDTLSMAAIAAVLPFGVWLIAYAVLAVRPETAEPGRASGQLCREYCGTATLLLVVSAVLPAASFFALSYDLHLEAFTKQRQIALARAVGRPPTCTAGEVHGVPSHGMRYDEALGWDVSCAETAIPDERPGRLRELLHGKIEEWLPYYTSAAIALRELMHARSDDGAWASRWLGPRRIEVTVQAREPQQRVRVASSLPSLIDVRTLLGRGSLVWTTLVALVALPSVSLVAFALVSFFLRRVLIADVVEPARETDRLPTAVGQHLLVVCDSPEAFARGLSHAYVLRLATVVQGRDEDSAWRRAREAVRDAAPVQRTVVPDLDVRSDDPGLLRRMLARIEELIADPEQTVIVLTRQAPADLFSRVAAAGKWDRPPERWTALMERLTVHDVRGSAQRSHTGRSSGPLAAWWSDLRGAVRSQATIIARRWSLRRYGEAVPAASAGEASDHPPSGDPQPATDWRAQLLADEGRCHPHLAGICRELSNTEPFRSGALTRDQILEEIEERATPFYQRIWRACDEDARVVLEHVARHGLASAASRRVVRRLLDRGLVRKDPELRLMNESFSRFVLETERRLEVATLERQAGPSLWDRLRVPIATAALIALAFLLTTQREAFDATVAMAAGVTTAVPTLLKLTTLLAQWSGKAAESRANV